MAAVKSQEFTNPRMKFKDIFATGQNFDKYSDSIATAASDFSLYDGDVADLEGGKEALAIYDRLLKFGYVRHEGTKPPPPPKPDPKPEPIPEPQKPAPETPKPDPKPTPRPDANWETGYPRPEPSKPSQPSVGWKQSFRWLGSAAGVALTVWTAVAFFAPIPSPIVEAVKLLLKALASIFS
jgi:hypothetical protein